jgi:uroporphyrin-3 C-methyltransferase
MSNALPGGHVQILAQLDSPSVYPIRQILAKNISQLDSTLKLDSAGLLSQLDALQNSIDTLKVHAMSYGNSESQNTQTIKPTSWKTELQNSLSSLQKLVVIRRITDPFQPLMSPLYQSMLRATIKLNLQEAQWAILNKNPKIYQLTLDQAIKNLEAAVQGESPETLALLKQLKDLQQVTLTHQQPKIDEALPLLNQVIETDDLSTPQKDDSSQGEQQP